MTFALLELLVSVGYANTALLPITELVKRGRSVEGVLKEIHV